MNRAPTGLVPPERLIDDRLSPCPYLPGETARLPLRLPTRIMTGEELDQRLEEGDRRQGVLFYRPRCPSCDACEALRIPVERFRFSRTHRRIMTRGDRELTVTLGTPRLSERHRALYDLHKLGRGLGDGGEPITAAEYLSFMVETACPTFELAFHRGGTLVGVAIADRGARSLSAVYCCWDPAEAALSLGTYSILCQLRLCAEWGLPWLYLGLWVRGNGPTAYKARFYPHQRLQSGVWRDFAAPGVNGGGVG